MPYLFNLAYGLALLALSPWLLYAACRHGKYREGWAAKFLGVVPHRPGNRRCVWLHAVSVGEVNLLQPLLQLMASDLPHWDIVVSSTTKTGYELAQKRYPDASVCYCPLDFSWAVRRAFGRIRPDLFLLIELELWPNLIRAARERGVPVAVVNGRLSDRSFRGYGRLRPVVASMLQSIDYIGAQNDTYAERFRQLGARPEAVTVTGSLKFDGAQTDRNNAQTGHLAELAGIEEDDVVVLAGSTQSPEEAFALEAFRSLADEFPRLKLIVVPRHPQRFDEVAALLDESGLPWQRRSELGEETEGAENVASRILLVDTIGELSAWWGVARLAYVGGSMGRRGGQNMIEPAGYGATVAFGPRTENFRDVVEQLLAADAATMLPDGAALATWVRWGLEEPFAAAAQGVRARRLVLAQQGATRRALEMVKSQLRIAN